MDGQAIKVHGRIAFSNANCALPSTARIFQIIPIKMKTATSVRKVTLMIATVRNTSLAERGSMNASHLAKPQE